MSIFKIYTYTTTRTFVKVEAEDEEVAIKEARENFLEPVKDEDYEESYTDYNNVEEESEGSQG